MSGAKPDDTAAFSSSFRERILEYVKSVDPALAKSFIKADDFKSYFRDERYTDLMEFEEDIASISTLIIICLESPGSLVELGMFTNIAATHRLLVIVPSNEVSEEDSFIFLGPLSI